jgi:hypothetical protein
MFGTIRKHQSWLWAIIITGTIVSFLVWFSPDARWGGGRSGKGEFGSIDGRAVTLQEYRQAYNETRLLYFLNYQKWPDNDERARQMGFDVENEAYMRLLRLAKVKEEKIQVSDEVVGQLVQRLLGPKMPLDSFVKEILLPHGVSEADFERFLRNDAAIQQLGAVAGLAGKLIPPREIETDYREQHEELSLEAVFFTVSNYMAGVTVTETNLLRYYSNNLERFQVPEKVRVSYVDFNRTNFYPEVDKRFAEITNLNLQFEQAYQRQDPASFTNELGKVLSKEEAIQKMKDAERNKAAWVIAARKANEFASKLYDEKDHHVEAFEKFAAAQGWPARVSAPFDQEDGPSDLKVPEAFARMAFAMTNKEEAIRFQPAEGEDGFYVFAVKEWIPSFNPPFESIRAKVAERYRFAEAQRLARLAGASFQLKLTNGLAEGKSFSALVTEAGLKVTPLPPISRATREAPDLPQNIYLPQLKNVAFNLQVGKASPYLPTMEGGFILYLRTKLPVNETKMKGELAEFTAGMSAQRQNEAFGLWFRKQAEHADLPINRATKQAPGPAKAPAPKPPAGPPAKAK